MNQTTTEEHALDEAMSKLESALLSPVVSGELDTWAETARQASAEMREPLSWFIKSVLKVDYAAIKESDPELMPRVQQMGAEDKAILEELSTLDRELTELARRAPHVDGDEAKLETRRELAEKRGTDLILSIKRQQAAIATWLNEALNRDRGSGD